MKKMRKLIFILLQVTCLIALVLPAAASAYAEHEGLEVTVVTDQENYEEGTPITATITVKNTNTNSVMIANLEQLIPDGYVLAEGSEASMNNFTIQAGETIVLEVTFTGESAPELNEEPDDLDLSANFIDKLINGSTWGIPNLLLVFVAIVLVIVFMKLT